MILSSGILTLLVAQLALGFDHSIDLERCKTDEGMRCYVRDSCITPRSNQARLTIYNDFHQSKYGADELKTQNQCDVVMQIRGLDQYIFHVMMQVKLSGSNKIRIDDGVKLNQGSDQFVCKPDGITGAFDFKIIPKGRQIFEDQHIFCSFFVEVLDKRTDIFNIHKYNKAKPTFIFTRNDNVTETIEHNRQHNSIDMWVRAMGDNFCDYNRLSSSTKDSTTDASMTLMEIDITSSPFRCTSSSFAVQKKSDVNPLMTSKVDCHLIVEGGKITGGTWTYEEGGEMKEIEGDFEIYCPIKRCRLCKTPPPRLSCPGCTAPTYTATGAYGNACPTLMCATGKLTVSGQSTLGGEAECKRSVVDPTVYTWFVGETELEKAACLVETQTAQKRHANTAVFEDFLTLAH